MKNRAFLSLILFVTFCTATQPVQAGFWSSFTGCFGFFTSHFTAAALFGYAKKYFMPWKDRAKKEDVQDTFDHLDEKVKENAKELDAASKKRHTEANGVIKEASKEIERAQKELSGQNALVGNNAEEMQNKITNIENEKKELEREIEVKISEAARNAEYARQQQETLIQNLENSLKRNTLALHQLIEDSTRDNDEKQKRQKEELTNRITTLKAQIASSQSFVQERIRKMEESLHQAFAKDEQLAQELANLQRSLHEIMIEHTNFNQAIMGKHDDFEQRMQSMASQLKQLSDRTEAVFKKVQRTERETQKLSENLLAAMQQRSNLPQSFVTRDNPAVLPHTQPANVGVPNVTARGSEGSSNFSSPSGFPSFPASPMLERTGNLRLTMTDFVD